MGGLMRKAQLTAELTSELTAGECEEGQEEGPLFLACYSQVLQPVVLKTHGLVCMCVCV